MRISLALFSTILLAFIAPLAVDACTRDDHCVPSSCCHATACVDTTKVPAPNCTEVMCTGGCHMESLDCGGECRCSKSQVCSPYIRTGMPPDSSPQHQWVDLSNQPPAAPQKIIRYVKRLRK
ncbi:Hypothetical protein, putative [Bodo saltans]|uniref:Membrane-associated protein n=1 Tax=Bodo saltans TaxID=75058 RepID=A0A0S4J1Y8_BODSA|nr:Hypothetical protein, putative [Bodo saltans]|eukprot:CUG60835.1 Hypothetical protein, putative [Bodo saltans]